MRHLSEKKSFDKAAVCVFFPTFHPKNGKVRRKAGLFVICFCFYFTGISETSCQTYLSRNEWLIRRKA
jgi:hypothetical protein